MNSTETNQLYLKEIKNTEIKILKPKEQLSFNYHFVNNPFFELIGNSDDTFLVEFYDDNMNLIHSSNITCNMWTKVNRRYFTDWKIKVYRNGKLIFDYSLDLSGQRVFITMESSSLGDTIAWAPYIEEFRKKHNCKLILSTFWNKLLKNSYPDIEFVEPGTTVHNLFAMYSLGWFYDGDLEPELPNTIPLQKSATNILGLEFSEIKPTIDFTPKENPYDTKYVTIATNSTSGLKYWNNKTGWQEVIAYLINNGYKVIDVSKEGSKHKGVEKLKDCSIENTMNVIHHSEFLIGLSSGLSWLSWGIGKHVVMISNFTEEDHEFTSNCTRIVNKSVCNGCWNNPDYKFDKGDWNWCPKHKNTYKQFECHKRITGEMVIDEIKKLLK
jgi:autotransporter strand-loop-strand O-heptosyltransferase